MGMKLARRFTYLGTWGYTGKRKTACIEKRKVIEPGKHGVGKLISPMTSV